MGRNNQTGHTSGIDLESLDEIFPPRLGEIFPSTTVKEATALLPAQFRLAFIESFRLLSQFNHLERVHKAVELAQQFDKQPELFRAWFKGWKSDPDYGFLCLLIQASQVEGVCQFQERNAEKTHARTREAAARIPELWKRKQGEGKSKNTAAGEIAKELHLSPATVRKKLQGL